MEKNNVYKAGNYKFRIYPERIIMEVITSGNDNKLNLKPVFTLSYSVGQFGYGLINHLIEQKDNTALINLGALSFTMNSLFSSNAEFREDIHKLIDRYLNLNSRGKEVDK